MENWTEDKEVLAQLPTDLPLVVESVVYREAEDSDGDPVCNVVLITPDSTDLRKINWDMMTNLYSFLTDYFQSKFPKLYPMVSVFTKSDFTITSLAY